MIKNSTLAIVETIREKAKEHGKYRFLSAKSGVGYEWLAKFANGDIENPTVKNIAKLELYFAKELMPKANDKPNFPQ